MKTDGLIFDIDGTLWNILDLAYIKWNEGAKQAGYDIHITKEHLATLFGMTRQETIDHLLPEYHLPEADRDRIMTLAMNSEKKDLNEKGGKFYPGTKQTLIELAENYHLSILTNGGIDYPRLVIEKLGKPEVFDDYTSHGENGNTKAENIRLLMERNHLQKAIYIGDTEEDRYYARQASIPFIYAEYGGIGVVQNAQYIAHQFADIPALAQAIFATMQSCQTR